MPASRRRLNEADAIFLPMAKAVGTEMAPVSVSILEGPMTPDAFAHQCELLSRLLPAMRRRIVRDRFSTALPRWVDVPDVDPLDHWLRLPAPGDGSFQAVLDWAGPWAELPFRADRAPWRAVQFDDVVVDGVPGRCVTVFQADHAMVDGGGAQRMAEHYLRFTADAPLAPLPPPEPVEAISGWDRWKEGWVEEGHKACLTAQATGDRLRWAAREPKAAAERAVELVQAARRLQEPVGPAPLSPLLVRRSTRVALHALEVDLTALKTGARAAGGSINDGLMAAVSLGLRQWHRDLGVVLPAVRAAMPVNRRPAGEGWEGNDVLAVVMPLPLDDDDPARLVKRCRELSLDQREDEDALWLLDRVRALGNRLPFPLAVTLTRRSMAGIDISVSNVPGIQHRRWVGGVEVLRDMPFAVGTLSALMLVMVSNGARAELSITTCPVAIPDPQHLLRCLAGGLATVGTLAG